MARRAGEEAARGPDPGDDTAQRTFIGAVVELHNPAQLDVLARAGVLARERLQTGRAASDETE